MTSHSSGNNRRLPGIRALSEPAFPNSQEFVAQLRCARNAERYMTKSDTIPGSEIGTENEAAAHLI